ncbi:hypothetical protein SAMN06297251_1013 [Fulvimarina manganoxydans]|uniref:Mutator family transposase n=1 Tax=Fulvimarina manganoxydans TaxID=937218 RepID=A0A1W1Y7V0_9HYPH|nr:hypothetical protein SAMN06297251_1013 [Fulvimarina manganoxydans]
MTADSTVSAFRHPDTIDDPLTTVLRDGARRLLAEAIEAEAAAFLAAMQEKRLSDGGARFVRHGHGPKRAIQTGIGPVPVKRAKVRDRGAGDGVGSERVTFTSAVLPASRDVARCVPRSDRRAIRSLRERSSRVRRTTSLDALLPVLYLRGLRRETSKRRSQPCSARTRRTFRRR